MIVLTKTQKFLKVLEAEKSKIKMGPLVGNWIVKVMRVRLSDGISILIRRDVTELVLYSLLCEDTARRLPPACQEESPHQEPNRPAS